MVIKYELKEEETIKQVKNRFMKELPGFFRLDTDLNRIHSFLEDYKNFENFVVLGIGGSGLGNRMLYELLKKENKKNVVVLDNIDPEWFINRIKNLNLKKTLFNAISKSGSTMETVAQYLIIKEILRKNKLDIKKHLVITTGNSGFLYEEANKLKIKKFDVPEDVGGRYSCLTDVGILSTAFAGIDVKKLISGARAFKEEVLKKPVDEAMKLAHFAWKNFTNGKTNFVLFIYLEKLNSFGEWWRQLWAESSGKNLKGQTPIVALGTKDQHSQIQLYLDGIKDKCIAFLSVKKTKDIKIPHYQGKFPFEGKKLSDAFTSLLYGTMKAVTEREIPNIHIELDRINEYEAGKLILMFMVATTYFCYLIDVNPFDQPAVELGKKYAYKYLESK